MATSTEEHVLQKRRRENVEITFAQRLAGNEKKIRDRAIKKLKKWIAARSKKSGAFSEEDLMKLWKGLFYCMWMSDKPLVQEELAGKIAELTHSFASGEAALGFFDACLLTIKREWAGIDYLRIDKFMMMVRKCLAQVLVVLKQSEWEDSLVNTFLQVLIKTPLNPDGWACPDGLRIHISDIYREELGKIGGDQLTKEQVSKFVDPFCILVTSTKSKALSQVMLQEFFDEIVTQSDVGMEERGDSEDEGIQSGEEEEKDEAPTTGGTKGNRKGEDEEGEKEEKEVEKEEGDEFIDKWEEHLAEIPQLQYDYAAIADRLLQLAGNKDTLQHVRKNVYLMVKKLRDLAGGIYPMPDLVELQEEVEKLERHVERDLDPELRDKTRLENKKKKNRKRKKQLSESEGDDVEGGQTSNREEEDDDESEKRDLKRKHKRRVEGDQIVPSSVIKKVKGESDQSASEKVPKKRKRRRKQKQQRQESGESQAAELQDGVVQEDGQSPAKMPKVDEGVPERVKSKGKDRRASRRKTDGSASDEAVEKDSSMPASSKDNEELQMASPPKSSKKRKNRSKVDPSEDIVMTSSTGDISSEERLSQTPAKTSKKIKQMADNVTPNKEDTSDKNEPSALPASSSSKKKRRKSKAVQGEEDKEDNVTSNKEDTSDKNEPSALPASSSSSSKKKRRKSKPMQGEEVSTPKISNEDTAPEQQEDVQKKATPMEKEITPISKRTRRKSAMVQAKLKEVDMDDVTKEVSTPVSRTRHSKRQSVHAAGQGGIASTPVVSADAATPTGSTKKRVKIALSQNEVRAPKDYRKRVQSSPGIPFDSTKKPVQPALKFTPPTTRARSKAMSAKKAR